MSAAPVGALVLLAGAMVSGLFYLGNLYNVPLLAYSMFAVVGAFVWAVWHLLANPNVMRQHWVVLSLLGFYAALSSVSWFTSIATEVSSLAWWVRVTLPCTFVIALALIDAHTVGYRAIWLLCVAVATLAAFLGITQFAIEPHRVAGPFTDPNNLAVFSLIGLFLTLPLLIAGAANSSWLKGAICVLVAVLTCAVFMTYSRVGMAVWLIGLTVLAIVAFTRKQGRWTIAGAGLFGVVVFAALTLFTPGAGTRYTSADVSLGTGIREEIWFSAISMWRDNPLLGTGLSTFKQLYPHYRSLHEQQLSGYMPHNDYLQLLQEGGPLLLLCALLLVVAVARRGLALFVDSVSQRARDPDWLRLGVALGIGATLASASVNFVVMVLAFNFILGCALALLFVRPSLRESNQATWSVMPKRFRVLSVSLVAVAAAGFCFSLAVDAVAYGVFLSQPGIPGARAIRDDEERFIAATVQIERLAPNRGLAPYSRAVVLHKMAQRLQDPDSKKQVAAYAEEAYKHALDVLPYNYNCIIFYGNLLLLTGIEDSVGAEAVGRMAVSQDPTNLLGYSVLGQALFNQGRERDAYELYRDGLFPWMEVNVLATPIEAKKAMAFLRNWSKKYGEGPSESELDRLSLLADRVIAAGNPRYIPKTPT